MLPCFLPTMAKTAFDHLYKPLPEMNRRPLLLCPQLSPLLSDSKQPYLFHPGMEVLVGLGKTLAHLYWANFSFQCLVLKSRSSFSCCSPQQKELHFGGGKFSAWVLSKVL